MHVAAERAKPRFLYRIATHAADNADALNWLGIVELSVCVKPITVGKANDLRRS
jgi:hypothetical protein